VEATAEVCPTMEFTFGQSAVGSGMFTAYFWDTNSEPYVQVATPKKAHWLGFGTKKQSIQNKAGDTPSQHANQILLTDLTKYLLLRLFCVIVYFKF
jgi:hypothetical protein